MTRLAAAPHNAQVVVANGARRLLDLGDNGAEEEDERGGRRRAHESLECDAGRGRGWAEVHCTGMVYVSGGRAKYEATAVAVRIAAARRAIINNDKRACCHASGSGSERRGGRHGVCRWHGSTVLLY